MNDKIANRKGNSKQLINTNKKEKKLSAPEDQWKNAGQDSKKKKSLSGYLYSKEHSENSTKTVGVH